MKRNAHMGALKTSYLFPEIHVRKVKFIAEHPQAALISLGIGDTTEPVPASIVQALAQAATRLGTVEGYSGYQAEQGSRQLREKIASALYANRVQPDEVFISDGAKCDLGRLQLLFGNDISIAVQDPTYPVYVDGSIIQGVNSIVSLPCTAQNGFFPDLSAAPRTDLIYFCSPNNPTGAVATRAQLKQLVDFATANRSIIIFDAAYASYIQDADLPASIFEIEGARKVAIEVGSFSKIAGFTGVRLGWSVVPDDLQYDDGRSVKADWSRLITTIFNGASNIAQAGGVAVLEHPGIEAVSELTKFYLANAQILRETFAQLGHEVVGGVHAPYVWVRFPGQNSWDVFQNLLDRHHIVTTPGVGFGPAGSEYIRLTGFGKRDAILEAANRLKGQRT